MAKHVISDGTQEDLVLKWRVVINKGVVALQCSKLGEEEEWWYIVSIGPKGELYREPDIPVGLGLSLNDQGRILFTEVEP